MIAKNWIALFIVSFGILWVLGWGYVLAHFIIKFW